MFLFNFLHFYLCLKLFMGIVDSFKAKFSNLFFYIIYNHLLLLTFLDYIFFNFILLFFHLFLALVPI